jgi:prepilin-type N-terminal cleavage/methylation domain-containing protein
MANLATLFQRRGTRWRRSSQRGFTLAEVAITLVLIGLLTGSVMLGDGMVTQSRIKSIAKDFNQLKVAVLLYQDRYSALPGDDAGAAVRWTAGAKPGTGDRRISGSYQAIPPVGNPMTALTVDATSGESLNFWWHLRLAQLIVAPPPVVTPLAQPLNHYGGVIGVEWAPLGLPRLAACTANLPGDVAIGLEHQDDDGNPRGGLARAFKQAADNDPIASADASITTFSTGEIDMFIICRRLD